MLHFHSQKKINFSIQPLSVMEGLIGSQFIQSFLSTFHLKLSPSSSSNLKENLTKLRKCILESPFSSPFKAPNSISLVGSHILDLQITNANFSSNIDLFIELPKGYFKPSDFKDRVYFVKKRAYLKELQRVLAIHSWESSLVPADYSLNCGGELKEILVLSKPIEGMQIKIHCGFCVESPSCPFAVSCLAPGKNAVSSSISSSSEATPIYNSLVLSDLFFKAHLKILHQAKTQIASFSSAVILLKAWIREKDLLNGFVICMIVVGLWKSGIISSESSTWFIFKETLKFISRSPWMTSCKEENFSEFLPVFYGFIGDLPNNHCPKEHDNLLLNLLVFWQWGDLHQLGVWAKYTLELFDLFPFHPERAFEMIFSQSGKSSLKPPSLPLWDLELKVSLKGARFESKKFLSILACSGGDYSLAVRIWIPWMLRKCLSERIESISIISHASKEHNDHDDLVVLVLRIKLTNEESASSFIQRGPLAERTNEAAFFRSLWGSSLSQLKRFADGLIYETVTCPSSHSANPLLWFIGTLLEKHASIPMDGDSIRILEQQPSYSQFFPAKDLNFNLKASFARFACMLKDLALSNGLSIASIYPVDAVFRGTRIDFIENEAKSSNSFYQAYRILLEFDTSRCMWPSQESLQRAYKLVLLGKLQTLLSSSSSLPSHLACDPYLDFCWEGHYFRLELYVPDSPCSSFSMEAFKFISSLAVSHSQSFLPACRMIKQWLDDQLIFAHLAGATPLERDLVVECCVGKLLLETGSLRLSLDHLLEHFYARARDIFTDEMPYGSGEETSHSAHDYKGISAFLKGVFKDCKPLIKRIVHLAEGISKGKIAPNALALGDFHASWRKRRSGALKRPKESLGNFSYESALIEELKETFKGVIFFWDLCKCDRLAVCVIDNASEAEGREAVIERIGEAISEFYQ